MKKLLAFFVVKNIVVVAVLFSMLYQQQHAYSQALPVAPVANFVMNRAIGGVLTRVAIARGFAANDPRIAATLVGAGTAITGVNVASTIAGVGFAVAGAPVWLTVAAGLGVLAIGSAIVAERTSIKLANNALTIDAAGSIVKPPYTTPTPITYDAWGNELKAGVSIYRLPECFPSQACYVYPPLPSGTIPYRRDPYYSDSKVGPVALVYWNLRELIDKYWAVPVNHVTLSYPTMIYTDTLKWVIEPHFEQAANGVSRLVGVSSYERTCDFPVDLCAALTKDYPPEGGNYSTMGPKTKLWDSDTDKVIVATSERPISYNNLDAAIPAIPSSSLTEKLEPDTLAKLADQAWMKAAAQPGYQGLPYSATQPVTTTDVASWQTQNPANAPTIGDLLTPANNPGSAAVPISVTVVADTPTPNPNPGAIQNVNVVNVPKIDLGPDPNIASPTLETVPHAIVILSPIIGLFPELRNYKTPQHAGECPKPVFDIFGKTLIMDSHCSIAEQHRAAIGAVMVTVWILVGLLILLSA